MAPRKSPYPKWWLVLGGMGFGLYFTFGLAYFETFGLGLDLGWLFYLPIWLVLALASTLLALVLMAAEKEGRRPLKGYVRWGVLPVLTFGIAGLLLLMYSIGPMGDVVIGKASLPSRLYFHMALVGLLPLQIALILVPQPRASKREEEAKPTLETKLDARTNENSSLQQAVSADVPIANKPQMLTIAASHGEAGFSVPQSDLIAVEAADNYCKFHYLREGVPKMKMLRITLKETEEALQGAKEFLRCHRSFLVNASFVDVVLGNSQMHRLKMKHLDEPIPVSRSFDVEPLRRTKD